MKKAFSIIALFAMLLLTSSAYSEPSPQVRPEKFEAPELELNNDNDTLSLSLMRGKYVLLTFWSSTDATSRVACNRYTTLAKRYKSNKQFSHVSVNFDRSGKLFNEIVRRDRLDAKTQFNVQGEEAAQINADFHLENGLETVLIDPDGMIIAHNPSDETLSQVLSE